MAAALAFCSRRLLDLLFARMFAIRMEWITLGGIGITLPRIVV